MPGYDLGLRYRWGFPRTDYARYLTGQIAYRQFPPIREHLRSNSFDANSIRNDDQVSSARKFLSHLLAIIGIGNPFQDDPPIRLQQSCGNPERAHARSKPSARLPERF